MSNKIKVILGVLALAVAVGVIVILIVNSQNQGNNNTVNNTVNETNVVENEVNNTTENNAVNNTVGDDKVKEGERDYSKKTMEEWKEAVKNFYDKNSSVMPDKIEVTDDVKNEKIIINTFDSEGNKLDEFEVDKRTWLAVGFEGNTIDFIAGKFVEIELHPKLGFKDDEEIAIAVYKTEEEKKKLIETYFENEVEFSKYTFYNFGTEQKLVIIPRYDTVFVSLTDITDKNYNPLVEDIRGKSVLVNLNTTGVNKTYSLVFSHLINNTEITLQNNPTTGELKLTKENPRVKVLSLDGTKTEPKKDNNL